MFFLLASSLGLGLGLLLGGHLEGLASLRLRWPFLVVLALVIKDVAFLTPVAKTPWIPYIYLLSLIGLLAWTVYHWSRLPGLWLISAGVAMNLMVVVANGSRMPVALSLIMKQPAVVKAALRSGSNGQYVVAGAQTHLLWLGDWLEMPWPLYKLFPQAYSPGDFLIAVGLFGITLLLTRPRALGRVLQFTHRRAAEPEV